MAVWLKSVQESYEYLGSGLKEDPRLLHLPFVSSPVPVLVLATIYLLFVLKWGPQFMKNREPYDLQKVLIVYNFLQSIICAAIAVKATPHIGFSSWYCNSLKPVEEDPSVLNYAGYSYFILKLVDLLDTVFFVLKKNYRQITVLHVSHHTIMAVCGWMFCKYLPSGHTCYLCYINLIVHAIMYGYYLLTAYDPKYKSNIYMKKKITQLQMCQFGLFSIIYGVPILNGCNTYPRGIFYFVTILNLFMIVMFSNFYYQTYIKKKSTDKQK